MNLDRPVRMIIFDWDGTAVSDRRASGVDLARALGRLLRAGVHCVAVTGTNFDNLNNQALIYLPSQLTDRLHVCTNRGSEVSRYQNGNVTTAYRRIASPQENDALDATISRLHDALAAKGLKTQIISNRLNRRKLDLIPLPRWHDPAKAELPGLLKAVNLRLNDASWQGGHKSIIDLAYFLANESGLSNAKITSDVKHIEIGLTDKSDSVRWTLEHIAEAEHISAREILVFGDEFGSVGGIDGSDERMRLTEIEEATFVSVGPEPGGVPTGTIHLPGGPVRFVDLLYQIAAQDFSNPGNAADPPRQLDEDPAWLLQQTGFEPEREREFETIFATGNGYLGVRGALSLLIPTSQPDLFVAGIYGQKSPDLPYSETTLIGDDRRDNKFTEIVALPFPFELTLSIDGVPLKPTPASTQAFSRTLDMRHNLLQEELILTDAIGRTTKIATWRCTSAADPHLLLQHIEIESLNYQGLVSAECRVAGQGEALITAPASGMQVAIVSGTNADKGDRHENGTTWQAAPGDRLTLRRMLSIFSSRDTADPAGAARVHHAAKSWSQFDEYMTAHRRQWRSGWKTADVRLHGRPELTQAMRFNAYHLRIADAHDPNISIGARTLSGRAYEGHIFWDTEIFMSPFFLLTNPEAVRSMLIYRHTTLPGAKRRAAADGYQGACYAWESTTTGDDVTPRSIHIPGMNQDIPIFTGSQQIHVTADIAYAICQYWRATKDNAFFKRWGIEILVETARFWRCRVVERDNMLHIDKVVGPDEYHHDVNDNAYTNWMARNNLIEAAAAIEWLMSTDPDTSKAIISRLAIAPDEADSWLKTAGRIFQPSPRPDGVIEQFDGFFALPEVHLSVEEKLRAPIARLADWASVNKLRLCKQADVLMIPYLFPNTWPAEVVRANFDYYEAITDHGSSLSPPVFAALAGQLGLRDKAQAYWLKSIQLDLAGTMQNTALGFHAACGGAAWQAIFTHWLGLDVMSRHINIRAEAENLLPDDCTALVANLVLGGAIVPIEARRKEASSHAPTIFNHAHPSGIWRD